MLDSPGPDFEYSTPFAHVARSPSLGYHRRLIHLFNVSETRTLFRRCRRAIGGCKGKVTGQGDKSAVFGNHPVWANQGLTRAGGQGEDGGREGDRWMTMARQKGTLMEEPAVLGRSREGKLATA